MLRWESAARVWGRLPPTLRTRWLLVFGVAALAFAFDAWRPVLAPFALALAAAAAWPAFWGLADLLRKLSAKRRVGSLIEAALVAAAGLWLTSEVLGFVLREQVPVDRGDHHVMIARAQVLFDGLRQGRIAHWSHLFQGGDSLLDVYPAFLSWLVALLHLVIGGGKPLIATYSLVCVGAWWLRGMAAYFLARRFSGPVPAILVALLALFDVGSEVYDGTWHGVFYWGMIHNNLALTIALFAAGLQIDVFRRATTFRIIACALLFGIATLAHPLGLLFTAVDLCCLTLAIALRAKRLRRPLYTLAATGLGAALAGFAVLPYVNTLARHGFNGGLPGIRYEELGTGLFAGTMPVNSFPAYYALAAVAVVAALGSSKVPRLAFGLLPLSFLLLAIVPFLVEARVFELFPSFLASQQRRSFTVAKMLLIPAMATLLSIALRSLLARPSPTLRALVLRAIVLLLVAMAPLRGFARGATELVKTLKQQIPKPAPSNLGPRENDTSDTHRQAMSYIKARRAEDPSPTPWRMVLWDRWDWTSHAHWVWAQGVNTGVPVVDFGWVSANFIRYRPRQQTPQGMTDWNIRYAIGLRSEPAVPGFVLRQREGEYHIWEFKDFDPRFVVAPAGVEITNLRVHGDHVEFDVKGAPAAGARVTVRSAWLPRWRATVNGEPSEVVGVPPHEGAAPGQDQLGLTVKNGHVVVSANATMPRFWLGVLMSLVAAASLGFIASAARRTRLETLIRTGLVSARERLRRVHERLRAKWRPKWMLPAVVAVGLLALFLFARRGTRLLLTPPIEGIGMDVELLSANGTVMRCKPDALLGRYECGEELALVEPQLGVTPPRDDSGEYGEYWAGTSLKLKDANSTAILRFAGIDRRKKQLQLDVSAATSFEVAVASGNDKTPAQTAAGNVRLTFVLPSSLASTGKLALHLSSASPGGSIVVRGKLQ